MNKTKRLISILMAISIAVSVLMVGSVSASAVTANAIKDVPTYKSRTAYIDSVRKGTTQASDSFVDTFEKVCLTLVLLIIQSIAGMKHILLKFILTLTCFIRKI